MIKLVITDVDGVIVGQTAGVNFPLPDQKVIEVLKKVCESNIPVILCTGKYYHAIEPIIHQANLRNPHITDSGSLIIDPLSNKIIHAFNIEKNLVEELIQTCLNNKIYVEAYSVSDYFIQKNALSDEITPKRTSILQRESIQVESLIEEVRKQKIIKLLPVAKNRSDRKKIDKMFKDFKDMITMTWSKHPSSMPFEYCLITSKLASKAQAVTKLVTDLNIPFENILGIGDTIGDWGFMKLCGYVATMDDAEDDLAQKVKSREKGKYFIGETVEKNGIISIFNYFKLNDTV
jgi:HAD superfamily hydrolase (TIGR01484 family)